MIAERARYHSTSSLGSGMPEPASCYSEFVRCMGHLWRSTKRRAKTLYAEVQEQRIKEQVLKRTTRGYYGKNDFTPSAHGVNRTNSERPAEMSAEGSFALVSFDYSKCLAERQYATPDSARLDNKFSGQPSSALIAEGCLVEDPNRPREDIVMAAQSPESNELATTRSHNHSESSLGCGDNADPCTECESHY